MNDFTLRLILFTAVLLVLFLLFFRGQRIDTPKRRRCSGSEQEKRKRLEEKRKRERAEMQKFKNHYNLEHPKSLDDIL